MARNIQVVVAEPGGVPVRRMIGSDLRSMQEVVGGPIGLLSVRDLDVWVCEEGIPLGYPLNRVVAGQPLVGTILVTGSDKEGETIGLTDEQARRAIDLLVESPAIV